MKYYIIMALLLAGALGAAVYVTGDAQQSAGPIPQVQQVPSQDDQQFRNFKIP